MNITLSVDWITISSWIFGLLGVAIAVYQTAAARKVRTYYEQQCKTRCTDAVEMVASLSEQATIACEIVNSQLIGQKNLNTNFERSMAVLIAKVDSITVITRQLIRFCERLNEEYEREFGYSALPDLKAELNRRICLEPAESDLTSNIGPLPNASIQSITSVQRDTESELLSIDNANSRIA